MIKLTGCFLIFISCCLFGHIKASEFKGRRKELEDILETIKLMEMDITYKKEPLIKSFQNAVSVKNCWFTKVLDVGSLWLKKNRSLQESWSHALKQHAEGCPLNREDLIIIEDMILGLGKSNSEDQRNVLEHFCVRLDNNLKKARLQEEKMGRMYRALGTAAGIILVILII